jgi:iron complex transport system substrate-binding protein
MIAQSTERARKSGVIPALSRNCGLPAREASQVRCSLGRRTSPRGEGQFVIRQSSCRDESPELDQQEVHVRTLIRPLLAAVLALSLLAACGGDDTPAVAGDAVTTTTAGTPAYDHIVSISPTATETLFAIGAGRQVVAVDDQSSYPTDAPKTDLSGYEPNVEAIASYEPDLVVSSSDDPELVNALDKLGIDVLVQEAAVEIDDVFDQITELGEATGHRNEARALASKMRSDLNEIKEANAGRPALTAYWELDPTFYSVTSKTFIGKLLGFVFVRSIADAARSDVADYPQLSSEYIVSSDPDLVILADTKCCGQDAAAVGARPGWGGMRAVTGGNVVELDDDIASRWGPRIVDLLRAISGAAAKVAA